MMAVNFKYFLLIFREEIEFLLACCETNHDGKLDYIGFIDRFHEPAKEIGFNLAVLLTNLSEHMPNEPRLARFLETAGSVLNYFEPFLGRIEIMGGSKKIERVYFEIKESNIEQWEKPQIKVRAFFYYIFYTVKSQIWNIYGTFHVKRRKALAKIQVVGFY